MSVTAITGNGSGNPRIVVLGGGFGGLEAAFYLRRRLGRRAELTLVSNRDEFLFKPNTIYIPFGQEPDTLVFPLAPTLDRRQIHFVRGEAQGVDPGRRLVKTSAGELPYDQLVVATGATTRPEEIEGLSAHANTVWTPEEMLHLRASLSRLLADARGGRKQKVLFLVPPNNKCSGPLYEIALMLDSWLRRRKAREGAEIAYATYEAGYIQAFGPRLHELVKGEFERRGITGHTGLRISSVASHEARFEGGNLLPFDLLVSFPPHAAAVRYEGLPSDERGFLRTDLETRQVVGHENVFAVGDAGDFPVKQAFLALLQADAVAERIAQRLLGEQPSAHFDPVSLCILEQFDQATFAQVPLRLTGNPDQPVEVQERNHERYKVGSGEVWRAGKKILGMAIPGRFRHGQPFHAGAAWAVLEGGVKAMSSLFAD